MLILLPPSESKSSRSRGKPADPTAVSFRELVAPRRTVAAELAAVSAGPDALTVLGVGPSLAEEVARNTRLDTAPALAVGELYTGVLYDALDLAGMDAAARRRATRWIVVVSALHGALRLGDRVAPYRLSMGVTLPGTGPLARFWRPHLEEVLTTAAGDGVVVDCRSSTYAAAGSPRGEAAERWVQVRVPGASHMAKHTRGLVAGHLCRTGTAPRTPEALAEELGDAFVVHGLTPPARPGKPWVLDVTPGQAE
ncbi:peroxide stress protein YaaA [Georgenia wutianyii]|uniref:Peroxide stress protein YaaA n=1 Tax=Georgenia wutianyii TaxID=2585135 RepID=A0ABX5VNM1_9MICO|nr:peroxide stress protein YaaA [Georgenia wutianyii]QDB79416.1 peroxide stress protein YaaA [Georgenia wutianyii]